MCCGIQKVSLSRHERVKYCDLLRRYGNDEHIPSIYENRSRYSLESPLRTDVFVVLLNNL